MPTIGDAEFHSMKDAFNAFALVAPTPLQKEIGSILRESDSYASFVAQMEILSRVMAQGFKDITQHTTGNAPRYCHNCGDMAKGFQFSFSNTEENGERRSYSFFLCPHCTLIEVLFKSSDMRTPAADMRKYRELAQRAASHRKCLFCSAALDLFELHVKRAASMGAWS